MKKHYEEIVYLLCICVVQVRIAYGAGIDTTLFGRMPVTGLRAGGKGARGGTDGNHSSTSSINWYCLTTSSRTDQMISFNVTNGIIECNMTSVG